MEIFDVGKFLQKHSSILADPPTPPTSSGKSETNEGNEVVGINTTSLVSVEEQTPQISPSALSENLVFGDEGDDDDDLIIRGITFYTL